MNGGRNMDQNNHLNRIKEELEKMEDEIIKERKERVTKEGSLFSYRLYEIKVQRCREEETQLRDEERKEAYKERFDEVVNQHQMNVEDTLSRELCLKAVKAIHVARNWQNYLA